ncbi:glycosyltransferase family 9 protein [Microcoleus sp. herbarium8]|uniref:glycosyltransferase family 9 protein n=1 Tax=Microcoleus sp. herbarium8 TaxID=3055436 RepID=UPI002FCF5D63
MLDPQRFRRPVVFFANAIGDHLIALPAIRALSHIFSGRLSLIVVREAYTEFFSEIPFESVWFIEPSELADSYTILMQKIALVSFNYETLAKQASGCDLFISLSKWTSPDLEHLVKSISPPKSIGFLPIFNYQLPEVSSNCFDTIFSIIHLFNLNVKIENFSNPPTIEPQNLSLVHSLKICLDKEFKLLIVHSDTKKRKMWSSDKFLVAIDKFLSFQPDYIAIIIGTFHELPLESASHRNRIFDICAIPLGLSFALLSVADLFLGIDSCMLHAADLFRVPGVGIFGPTDPKEWGFRFAPHKHISSDAIASIASEQVIDALMSFC